MEKKYLDEFKIAREFLEVSKNSLKSSLRTSANRLYFAFEKSVISYLLFLDKKVPKNHQKIWNLCSEYLGENFYDHFRDLYDLRMQADYGNISKFVSLDEGVLRSLIEKSELLIKNIELKMGENPCLGSMGGVRMKNKLLILIFGMFLLVGSFGFVSAEKMWNFNNHTVNVSDEINMEVIHK